MNKLLISKGNKPRKGKVIKCHTCKKEFYRQMSTSLLAKYCSYECHNKSMIKGKNRKCKTCNKEYYRPPSQVRLRGSSYCSYPCANIGTSKRFKGKIKKKEGEIWNWRRADSLFSDYIRQRDGWTCRRCKKTFFHRTGQLHNSHFWSRGRMITRFDQENCIALCFYCHKFKMENEKQGEYKKMMIDWLGQEKYDLLEKRANQESITRDEAIRRFMVWFSPLLKDLNTPKKKHWPPSPFDEDLTPEDNSLEENPPH